MTNIGRMDALKAKHESLDIQIQTEMRRPVPNNVAIQALKKQKLHIKEQMPA